MALAYLFYYGVARDFSFAVALVLVVIEAWALVNCLTQRADAFPVVGSLSKNAWLGILLASVLVTLVCGVFLRQTISIFAFIAIIAAGVYLLDVRPALRDATNGSSGW